MYVEVKGTATAGAAVFLTTNEVEFARAHSDQMALSVTRSVVVTSTSGGYPVPGGRKPCSDRGTWTPGT